MNVDYQDRLRAFVDREVRLLASPLVEDLLNLSYRVYGGIDWEAIENPYVETDKKAREMGYESLDDMLDSGSDRKVIYEWWFVTPWLGSTLRDYKEPIIKSEYGWLWGRTCTGQPIYLDEIIADIYINTRAAKNREV